MPCTTCRWHRLPDWADHGRHGRPACRGPAWRCAYSGRTGSPLCFRGRVARAWLEHPRSRRGHLQAGVLRRRPTAADRLCVVIGQSRPDCNVQAALLEGSLMAEPCRRRNPASGALSVNRVRVDYVCWDASRHGRRSSNFVGHCVAPCHSTDFSEKSSLSGAC